MSKFALGQSAGTFVGNLQTQVKAALARQAADSAVGQKILSAESLSFQDTQALKGTFSSVNNELEGALKTAFENSKIDLTGNKAALERLSLGLEAATVVALARNNLNSWGSKAGVPSVQWTPNAQNGEMLFQPNFSQEAFDRTNAQNYIEQTITWNVLSARQDDFAEAFFPTIVATPDQSIFMVQVDRTLVYPGYKHVNGGAEADFNRKSLLDAVVNPDILKNNITDLVPYKNPDNSQNAYFSAVAGLASTRAVGSVNVPTAPLVFDKSIGLLGLSAHPTLLSNNVFTEQDAIDPAAKVVGAWLKVTKATDESYVFVDLRNAPGTQFFKTPEGDWREMLLNMNVDTVTFSSATKDIAGAVVPAFAAFTGKVQVRLRFKGDLNVQSGNLYMSGQVEIVRVFDANGNNIGTGAADVTGVTFELDSFELSARRTNSNYRSRGILVEQNIRREGYTIPVHAPVHYTKPVNADASYDASVNTESLINTTRVQTNNAAVQQLLDNASLIRSAYEAYQDTGIVPKVEGLGRELVKPYYRYINVKMSEVLNSVRSQDKLADIQGYFTTLIGQAVAEAMTVSGYWAAVSAMTGGVEQKPTVVMGTDTTLPQYLMVQGDDRTVGPLLKPEVVSTNNRLMRGKIMIALRLTDGAEYHPLNYGNHIWIPELVGEIQMIRDGSLAMEVGVQRRNRHILNCPVQIEIDVEELELITSGAVEFINNPVTP
jgi:hypothetical protein